MSKVVVLFGHRPVNLINKERAYYNKKTLE
ncbi:hypothetical protein P378_06600 [Desulforamulus profundi]|uniref:Uncharacterized protein n=1 Tax=Desulforamulus profundi TaxID=1383067 RepID=A0A2C6M9I4_9FIRM|nr:hypothetical protein P378_06600 [Desulforamulus profundi]